LKQPELLAVIGYPVDHSLSPAMHNAALSAAGLPPKYEALRLSPSELTSFMPMARKYYRGLNVTIPHKLHILPLLDDLSAEARSVGAVNTVVNTESRLVGYNTDPEGFRATLRAIGFDPHGSRVVVFGAGGAARAVIDVLGAEGAQITVANRRWQPALRLASEIDAVSHSLSLDDPRLAAFVHRADILVNATPMGMGHLADENPLPANAGMRKGTVLIDLIYGRETPFLRAARLQGCRTADGLEMLVHQGAAAFRLFTGLEPNVEVMREACVGQLSAARGPNASEGSQNRPTSQQTKDLSTSSPKKSC
jgi:shikimate dehydrogenase